MLETLKKYLSRIKEYWSSRTKRQKLVLLSSIAGGALVLGLSLFFLTRTQMVPLYTNLKPSETGSIKESLDEKGIMSEIANGGSTILVPEANKDTLLVELASEGLPKSGNVAPNFFSENASFGMTDNEFKEIQKSVVESKLAGLMENIEGVQKATVVLNLPEKGIFVNDTEGEATASIVLQTKAGQEFDQKQIKSLYNLAAKSIPNLSTDNIVIRNQYLEYFDLEESDTAASGATQQMKIKKQIEKDIQRQVQNMLGTLMGFDRVVSSVTADVDFTQENREENLVTPVDEENMRGIEISAQRITESFSGNGAGAGGVPQSSDPADSGAPEYMEGTDGNGDYERSDESINSEVNRIRKQIVESPYKIRDLGIQVFVDQPGEGEEPLPAGLEDDVRGMLSTIVRTSIDKTENTDITDQGVQDKITVLVQPFQTAKADEAKATSIPWWVYVIGGLLLVVIGILAFFVIRKRRAEEEYEEEIELEEEAAYVPPEVPDLNEEILTESGMKKQQLEKLAKDKPDEFAKLLRSWLTEE